MRALATPLTDALDEVAARLANGGDLRPALTTVVSGIAQLPPREVSSLDGAIAAAAKLWHRPPRSRWLGLLPSPPSDGERLLATPELGRLFLHHRDGRLREAALRKVSGGLSDPFGVAAVLWRLNDWAQPVRDAAAECAGRCFPATDPLVLAEALGPLLVRQASWRRWNAGQEIALRTLARADVAAALGRLIRDGRTGRWAAVLRHAMRTSALDVHLPDLAFGAAQPAVRVAALGALIDGEAAWPAGFAWQWVDKSMGVRRRVLVIERRALAAPASREEVLARGVADRLAAVRRAVLAGVVRHLLGTASGRELAARLAEDRSCAVRRKAAFILAWQGA